VTHSSLTDQIRLSPQHSPREGTEIDTFLIHHQAATNDDAVINGMVTGTLDLSANYTINSAGRLTCVVDEDFRAHTSGSKKDGGKGAAWDRRAVTVEIANSGGAADGWPISDASIEKAARLLLDLGRRYRIVHVLGHEDLWERYRASYPTYCPGPDTVPRIQAKAAQLRGTPAPAPIPAPTPVPPAPSGSNWWLGITDATGLQMLRALYGYTAGIDNSFGSGSWAAMQRFLKANWGYTGPVDGEPGPATWAAIARWVRARYGYVGNDAPGPVMRAAVQRASDANKAAY
jgi:hypothetical protein